MLETIRAFVAVNIEIGAVRRIAAVQRSLRTCPTAPPGKISWVSPPNLHITLRSFGEIDRSLAPAVADGLRTIVDASKEMRLQLTGIEAYPSRQAGRLLIVDTDDSSGTLQTVAVRIEQLAQSFGLPPEKRPFRAHLTLARMADPTDVAQWFAAIGQVNLGEARAVECVLYESELERPGGEYVALERIPFVVSQPGRSQRPQKPTRQTSQRPKPKSKAPPLDPTSTDRAQGAIPPPPKVPSIPGPVVTSEPMEECKPNSLLPPAVEAALPPDEDWGD